MFNFIDFYQNKSKYKFAKLEKSALFAQNMWYLINVVSDMFIYEGMPDEVRTEFIEFYLCSGGGCGFGKVNEKYVACMGGRCGDVDPYGIGTDFTGAFPSGTLEGKINKDVVFIQNNQLASPDPFLLEYAKQLTEIDISIDTLIKNSRAGKVPIADNETSKTAIEQCYEKIYSGMPVAITNSKPLEKMLNPNNATYELIDFTDTSDCDRIQHLLKAKDDILRQFHNIYGHGSNGGYKLAQESVSEVNRNNDIAFIYPNIKLKWRKKACEQINKLFGLNVSVDFSESWKIEHDEVLGTNDDQNDNVSRETTENENVSRETIENEEGVE